MFERKGFAEYVGGTSGNSYASGLANIESIYNVDIDIEYKKDRCAALLSKIESDKKRKDLSGNELHYRRNYFSHLKKYVEYCNSINEQVVYWPSLEDYNPGITKEMWAEVLRDSTITTPETLSMLKKMLGLGGESTCAHLAEVYGNTHAHYNIIGSTFGKRVKDKYNCIDKVSDTTDRNLVYVIPFVGRNVTENGHQRYSWKLRDELKEALEEMDIIKEEYIPDTANTYSLNTILYGPPGTGKTYNSVNYAVAIIEGKDIDVIVSENHDEVLKRYNAYKEQGMIAFTTFHQSYGYEEFIEGIKPVVDANDNVQYSVEDGIFKSFCKTASMPEDTKINHNAKVWKVVLKSGDLVQNNTVKFECFNKGKIMYDWNAQQEHIGSYTYNKIEHFRDRVNIGDVVLTYAGHGTDIDGVGIVTDDAEYDEKASEYKWSRRVEWIQYNNVVNIRDLNSGKYFDNDSLQELKRVNIVELFMLIGYFAIVPTTKKYVFIIDEINRGNISKIFGELITLIEDTKRLGRPEETTAVLPYSGKPFGVPDNVYILGTMNTADRSIAQIDTALRRRFSFVEMMPDTTVLEGIEVEGVNIADMLDIINRRIEVLYDREHTIGHAFFTGLRAEPTIEKLATIFKKSIIPLLQEYFYEDYKKIRLVLGDNRKSEDAQFIIEKAHDYAALFGDADVGLDEGCRYEINKNAFNNIEAYRSI